MSKIVDKPAQQFVQDLLESAFPTHLSGPRKVGPEEEYPVIDSSGYLGDLTPLFVSLVEDGWKPKHDSITGVLIGVTQDQLEIGMDVGRGTLEIGFPPVSNLYDHLPVRREILDLVDRILATQGLYRLNDYAIQPRTLPGPELWALKGRAEFFKGYFPSSVHMQTLTASSQVHVDVTRSEALRALEVMLALSPVLIALNANSPIWASSKDPHARLATRQSCWYDFTINHGHWNNVFCGRPHKAPEEWPEQAPMDFSELAAFISHSPFVVHAHNKIVEGPGVSFEDWYNENAPHLSDELKRVAYLNHEGTIWWDARLRPSYKTIEVRPCCQNKDAVAKDALILGLIENLDQAHAFIRKGGAYHTWRHFERNAIQEGLHAFNMPLIANIIIQIAEEGLQRRGMNEEYLLQPLNVRVLSGTSPAHEKLNVFEQAGIDGLIHHLINS